MTEPVGDDPQPSFRRTKKRPNTRKYIEEEPKVKTETNDQGANEEDEETEVSSRLADIHEAQITRKRRNGMTALECALGKKLASEFDELDDDPFKMRGGGMMQLSDDKKLALEAADIEHGIKEQFRKETLLRDEHEEMKKFIDQRLNRETTSLDPVQKKLRAESIEDQILMKAAEKLSGFKSKLNEELLSNQMLVGIPEVDLGIDVRIKNVMATEQKKNELLMAKKNKPGSGR